MVNVVATKILHDGPRNFVINMSNFSDGTEESGVIKVNISELNAGPQGAVPTHVAIYALNWSITGDANVQLFFDAATDDAAITMSGEGSLDLSNFGGWVDPKSTTWTGDVRLTTLNLAASDSYNITAKFKKRYA